MHKHEDYLRDYLRDRGRLEILQFLFILVFTVVTVLCAWSVISVYQYFDTEKAVGWPMIEGSLLYSKDVLKTPAKGGAYYCMSVAYSYKIGGKIYYGSRLRFDYDCPNPDKVPNLGKRVNVHFNPENPENSVLIVDTSMLTDIADRTKILFVWVICGFAFLLYLYRKLGGNIWS